MLPTFTSSESRRASTRLITLVALAAVAAGAFYFVGTGDDDVGEEPTRPTKKAAKRPAAEKVAAVSVSESKSIAPGAEKTSPREVTAPDMPRKSEPKVHEPIAAEVMNEPASAAKPSIATTTPSAEPAAPPVPATTTSAPSAPQPATIPAKIARYAEKLLQKNDRDASGKLEFGEWRQLTGIPQETDADGDGSLSADELTQFVAGYGRSRRLRLVAEADPNQTPQPAAAADGLAPLNLDAKTSEADKKSAGPRRDRKFYVNSKRVPQGLPDWFLERDADGDAQLTPAEFAPMSVRADLDDFAKLDLNSDGLLTADEYVRASTTKPAAEKSPATGTNPAPPAAK